MVRLRARLDPKREVFRSGNIDNLRSAIREISSLAEQARDLIKSQDTQKLDADLVLVIRGILTEPITYTLPAASKTRPSLRVEDDYDGDYDHARGFDDID